MGVRGIRKAIGNSNIRKSVLISSRDFMERFFICLPFNSTADFFHFSFESNRVIDFEEQKEKNVLSDPSTNVINHLPSSWNR